MDIGGALQLAVAHHRAGRFSQAADLYRAILEANPTHADALHLLGLLEYQTGRPGEAVRWIAQAIACKPAIAEFHQHFGLAFLSLGRIEDAGGAFAEAVRLKPGFAQAHHNLGFAFEKLGQLARAVEHFREAIRLQPDDARAHNSLGAVLKRTGQVHQAIACFQEAIRLLPDYAEAHSNLGTAWRGIGKVDQALACLRAALSLKPDFAAAHSNYLFALHYSASHDGPLLIAEHARWAERHARPLADHLQPHVNEPRPDRRLRLAYVSPNFREHPVSFFLEPILACHDHHDFEVICYSDTVQPDDVTARLRACADAWHDTVRLSDENLAGQIRADGIDILVDLTLHMQDNRMGLFARKPAPVQVTYLGYPSTTGLPTMDYQITDPYLHPVEVDEPCRAEQLVRLPRSYFCYRPHPVSPDVGPLPALKNGFVTFAGFHSLAKINGEVIAAWSRVLHDVPGSRLAIKAAELREATTQADLAAQFAAHGIPGQRLILQAPAGLTGYLAAFQDVDIGLDTFPFNGGTTTCHTLWMGVPVVTLTGQTAVGRMGISILANLGLPDLATRNVADFCQTAKDLAGDLPRLAALRAGIRPRMQASPLMDAAGFTRELELAYRQMWRDWCFRRANQD